MSARAAARVLALGVPLLVALTLAAPRAHAQALADIDSLVANGRFTDARAALARWQQQHPATDRNTPASERSHALLLTGRLATDAAAAHDAYLALALGYPTAPETPAALLRLGQGMLATGEPERARGYLERLALDYPTAAVHADGLLWLARAQRATGRATAACNTARDALRIPALGDETGALLRAELAACAPQQPPATRSTPDSDGHWAVQAGAFRTVASAQRLARTLAAGGFTGARIVVVPANALVRVRLGRFASSTDATAFARRLFDAGFDAAVVDDAHRERQP